MHKQTSLLVIIILANIFSACSSGEVILPTSSSTASPTQTPLPQFPGLVGLQVIVGTTIVPSGVVIPTLEQVRLGKEVSVDPETQKEVDDLIAKLEAAATSKISGAVGLESQWNGGTGNDLRLVTYGIDSYGNMHWAVKSDGTSFNEVPLLWSFNSNGKLIVSEGQQFQSIYKSKEAVLIFSGSINLQGLGEKPVLVRDPISTSDGQAYYCQYFDLESKTWQFIPEVLKAVLPKENQNYLVWQVENGDWLAGPAETEAVRLVFDLYLKEWQTAMAPRPDFESMSDQEFAQAIYDYGVLIESQLHLSSEELEALPFASSPPELIYNRDIKMHPYDHIYTGLRMWSAELIGEKETPVLDEIGLQIGVVRLGYFGGTGDTEGERKIFTALVGEKFWGKEPFLSNDIELEIGRRYDLRIGYREGDNIYNEAKELNSIIEQRHSALEDKFPDIEENLFFSLIVGINRAKLLGGMGEFYRGGLPNDPNIIWWPEYIG